jgi:uridine kinase
MAKIQSNGIAQRIKSMLGEVLLITEQHKKAAQAVYQRVCTLPGDKIVIAVGGESGSGKSALGHEIARLLKERGTPAKLMHIDNYYKTSPKERTPWRKTHGIASIGYNEYDWQAINRNIAEFRADANHVLMPCIDLLTDQEDQLQTSFKGLRYLVIEGLYALQASADIRIFLEPTYLETQKAQELRGKENLDEWRLKVLEREHQVVISLRAKADWIITKQFDLIQAKFGEKK